MKSILFVDQFADLGGSQRSILDLLPALSDYKLEMAAPGPGPLTAELERHGVHWHPLDVGDYHRGGKSLGDAVRYGLKQPQLVRRLTELARGKSLICAVGPRLFPAASMAARRADVPLMWCLHLEIESARDRKLLEVAASLGRPRVVACSQACLDRFSETSAVRRNASIVYIGVEEVRLVRHAPDPASPLIGLIGRIHPDKGIADLLAAADEVLFAFPDARFRIAGPRVDAEFALEMEKRAAELGEGRVEFLGEVANPAEALSGLDLLVMPSRREAASRVVTEAFSAGVPVIASDAGGLPEIVERNGMLFPRGNPSALASAIIRALLDPMLRQQMIRAGRAAFEKRWRVERYRQEMRAEIEREIARQPPSR